MQVQVSRKWFWAGWGTVAACWQYHSLKTNDGATFSETTRSVLRTQTMPGKLLFLTGLGAFVTWFPKHILKPVGDALAAISGNEDEDSG